MVINYDVPAELSGLADAVQAAYSKYGDMSATREPLKINFILTLTLVLLITMLAAVYGAVWSAQRLTRPVKDLIAGTRAVGKGDFGTRLPLPSRDEMGFLVHSFNDMTKRLRRTSEEAALGRQAVERERERLAVILSRLSSGVLVVDAQLHLRSANQSAGAILGGDLAAHGRPEPRGGRGAAPLLGEFVAALRARLAAGEREWREQLALRDEAGTRVLLWACTPLPRRQRAIRPGDRVRGRHRAAHRAAQCRLGRSGAAPRARDQESADAHPAVGRAAAAQAPARPGHRARAAARARHAHHRAAGRCHEADGQRLQRIRPRARRCSWRSSASTS